MATNFQKKDIAKILSDKTGYPVIYSKKLIDDLINLSIDLVNENTLNFKNFGTFRILKKKERIGRNPKTKEKKIISERKVVLFKPSKDFKKFINENVR